MIGLFVKSTILKRVETMILNSFHQGPFTQVIFGYEPTKGIFLSVLDNRLQPVSLMTKEDYSNENGIYLELHTGTGTGTKVTVEDIKIFMERFAVPQEHIDGLIKTMERHGADCSSSSGDANKRSRSSEIKIYRSTRCEYCGTWTTLRCSRCKALPICSQKCMKENWLNHKEDCISIVKSKEFSKKQFNKIGYTPCESGGSSIVVTVDLTVEKEASDESIKIYKKYGLERRPVKDTRMPIKDKIELLLEELVLYDSSSEKNKKLALTTKLFFNRRYNNIINHAADIFNLHEEVVFCNEMRRRRIGESQKV